MRFMRGFVIMMALLGAGGGAAQTADAPGPPRELGDVKVEQRATAAAVTAATSARRSTRRRGSTRPPLS